MQQMKRTIRYMHELTEIRKERPMSVKQSAKISRNG